MLVQALACASFPPTDGDALPLNDVKGTKSTSGGGGEVAGNTYSDLTNFFSDPCELSKVILQQNWQHVKCQFCSAHVAAEALFSLRL